MKFFCLFILISSNLLAKNVKLKDLAVSRPKIMNTVVPKAPASLLGKSILFRKNTDIFSVKPQSDFLEKLYAEDFDMGKVLKEIDVSRPPIEGKFQYQF